MPNEELDIEGLALTDEELAGYGVDVHLVADEQLRKAIRGVLHWTYV
jgi:hypothetical protein